MQDTQGRIRFGVALVGGIALKADKTSVRVFVRLRRDLLPTSRTNLVRLGEGAEKLTWEYYGFTKADKSPEGGQFSHTSVFDKKCPSSMFGRNMRA